MRKGGGGMRVSGTGVCVGGGLGWVGWVGGNHNLHHQFRCLLLPKPTGYDDVSLMEVMQTTLLACQVSVALGESGLRCCGSGLL